MDFKLKAVTRDREGHYIMTKWSIHQEDINIVSIYAPNFRALKYLKQILIELKEVTSPFRYYTLDFPSFR